MLPIHLFAIPAAMDKIMDIASKQFIPVLEDSCQSHGATNKSHQTGPLNSYICYPFFPKKNITSGEDVLISTNQPNS